MKSDILNILDNGTPSQVKTLFAFSRNDDSDLIRKKFSYWARYFFPKFFESPDAPFHREMDLRNIEIYKTGGSFLNIAFRNSAKTTRTKLFVAYCIANDLEHYRKYFKILSKELSNAKQITTDVYNMLISRRVKALYPEVFEKTEKLREETMASFTSATGVKMTADTVGTDQRGDIQDESRPDFLWYEDFETRLSLMSATTTHKIWENMEEAKTGLAKDGGVVYTCNYLSERGNVHKLVEKIDNRIIIPIEVDGEPNWARYSKDNIQKIKKDVDDYAGEYLCLKPDTLILIKGGWKEISLLKVGDKVITHLNREQKISQVFKSNSEDLLDITVDRKVITITKNHPVLTIRGNIKEWIPAGELIVNDLIVVIPHSKLNT